MSEKISAAESLLLSSEDNVGTEPGQFSEAMRINFTEAINKAKAVFENESTDARGHYVAEYILAKTVTAFSGGIKPQKLTGVVFGAEPSQSSSKTPGKAFDGDIGTYYQYFAPDNGFVGIDLGIGNETALEFLKYLPRTNANNRFKGNKFQGSLDGVNYVDLYTIPADPQGDWQTIQISDSTAYRYYRYFDIAGSNDWSIVSEIEFYGYKNQDLKLVTDDQIDLIGDTANQLISNDEILADHGGLPAEFITFTVKSLPENGALSLNGAALQLEDTFTQQEINEQLLTYSNGGSRKGDSLAACRA